MPSQDEQSNANPRVPQPLTGLLVTLVLRTGLRYFIQEEVLCKLKFFSIALRKGYRETFTKIIHLPEDDPELIRCLLQYLHTGNYRLPASLDIYTNEAVSHNTESRMQVKLFHTLVLSLADKYMCAGLARVAAINVRKIFISPISFVDYMVSVYEMTAPGSRLRVGYFVDYGCKDDLLIVHPQWTISSYTRAYITRVLLYSKSAEAKFIAALDRCPQLAIDLVALISKGVQPVPKSVTQFPGTAKAILVHHCKQEYHERPWGLYGELVEVPWGWWKG